MKKNILVTGGAGFIGSHTVRMLAENTQDNIIVVDNLVYGHKKAIISKNVKLIKGDLADYNLINKIFSENKIDAVIHFAAYAYVGESVTEPLKYYDNNLASSIQLLKIMQKYAVKKFIFSSTCATYGNPQEIPMTEKHPQNPINPYGMSKLMLERVLKDCDPAWGLKSVILRYFNACGCAKDSKIGEDHQPETHLIPLALMAVKNIIPNITIFGTDYPTPDGTCIRDYIHVLDLAKAHLLALDYLNEKNKSTQVNIGTGNGVSVFEIIKKIEAITKKEVPVIIGERRAGDPPELIADPKKANELLKWSADYPDVYDSIETAWNWINQKHNGRYKN